jgi:di/tricarboxylate transporter
VSPQLITIFVLALVFLVGTVRSVNLGALALVAAFGVGVGVFALDTDEILAGFPAELFVILVGVTFLFAIASGNGTVDWLVQLAIRAVGGHVAAIPWIVFLLSGVLVAFGAVSPAAVAIIAPIGMTFARRYGINPLMMGLMVVHGSAAGNFSPIGVLGVITNGVVDRSGLLGSPTTLFLANLAFNVLLGLGIYFGLGGLTLLRERRRAHDVEPADAPADPAPAGGGVAVRSTPAATRPTVRLDRDRLLTTVGLGVLVVGALGFGLDVGLTALTVAAVLAVVSPQGAKQAVGKISWSVVLLICGIVTYVGLMQSVGTVDYLGGMIGSAGAPLVAALLVCYIGAVVSAFASTTGILGALIPLAVPLMATGQVSAIGLVAALSISASVVDSSPFSTNGALVVANAGEAHQERVYRQLMKWGMSLVVVAPLVTWLALVLPAGT